MAKYTIILPAHNAAGYMRKALDSIREQTFKDYELIVVCDACEDNSAEVAREYEATVLEVNYRNPGLTRNRALDIASGEWIMFMDDDDWWLHEFVLEQIDGQLGDEDVLCFSFIWKGVGYTKPVRPGNIYWPAPWTKCWRRSAIGDTRFPSEYPDDLLFTVAMFEKRLRVKAWDMPLYYYNYMRPGSISDEMHKIGVEPDYRRGRDGNV